MSVLFALLGFFTTVGAFLFAFPDGLGGFVFGSILVSAAILFVISAARLHKGETWVWNMARALVGAEIAWSIYKVFIYGETESAPFLVAAGLAAVLLHLPSVRAFVQGGGR